MNTVLLDSNVYDKLQADVKTRRAVQKLISCGLVKVIATPIVHIELKKSPFGGFPNWFPIVLEAENVMVLGYATLGMTRLGEGEVYSEHRGESKKIPDAILADSADGLADILVSEDRRCRERLKRISTRCRGRTIKSFLSGCERHSLSMSNGLTCGLRQIFGPARKARGPWLLSLYVRRRPTRCTSLRE